MAKVTKILDFCYLCFMILFPPCKINLGLHILNKREDGYHNLDTLMVQLPFNDVLEIIPSAEFSFSSSGLEISGDVNFNLCVQAFRLMKATYNIPNVTIHLHKIIPMGGGLGGGSSDASYVLLGINELFNLGLEKQKLQELAAQLGSDCPLFIEKTHQIANGRGEILTPFELDLSRYYIKLVNVGIHVSTRDAFSNVHFYDHPEPVSSIVSKPIETWKEELKNDFEHSVFQFHPQLMDVKEKLYAEGAVYAAMSGSGSTMFGIYREKPMTSFENWDGVYEKIILPYS